MVAPNSITGYHDLGYTLGYQTFKLERLDYKAIHVSECSCRQGQQSLAAAVASIDGVTRACWHRDGFLEAYMDGEVSDETIRAVVEFDGRYRVERID